LDLYLHIGTEKTGTTSLQKFLKEHRNALGERRTLYPLSPGKSNHTALATVALDDSRRGPLRRMAGVTSARQLKSFRADFVKNLAAELKDGSYDKVIMSNEHCSTRLVSDPELEYLRDLLKPFFDAIHIVVYIRRQDDYLLSGYSTHVKNGLTDPVRLPEGEKALQRYDHWGLLSRWARVFGRERIVCRKYERTELVGGSIEDDFLAVVGVAGEPDLEKQFAMNQSLDASALEFLRLFNKYTTLEERPPALIGLLASISDGPLMSLPEETLAAFMEQFRESNRLVAEEYFGGALPAPGDPLFGKADSRARSLGQTLDVERVVQIAAHLWRSKASEFPARNPSQIRKFEKPARPHKISRRKARQERKRRVLNEE
jgi:hypothetical protein